jgi:hypothetical protein
LVRGLVVRVKNGYSRLEKEPAKGSFVARPLGTHRESCAQFSHHDEGQPDFVG